jgi:metallo-beta-lactamase class B
MRNQFFATAIALFVAAAVIGAQDDTQVLRGAAQPNQNKWSAKAPWGETERSVAIAGQKKDPFKVFDNVYYVGFQAVSVYLVTTSTGLVLIDSGFAQTSDWLLESIRKTGNDPKNIKYILVTHSHADHYGGAARVKQESGARIGVSAVDWGEIERQQSTPPRGGGPAPTIQRDLILSDGGSLTVGDQTFKFYFTPGHTPGATSIEFQVKDGGRSYRTILPGGLGVQYQANWGPAFKKSIQTLRRLGPWDVALGNHPFLAPKDLEVVEAELETRGKGPHPAVLGPERIDAFFDAILKIVDEKLVAEPPTGVPTT